MAQALHSEQVMGQQLGLYEGAGLRLPSVQRGRTAAQPPMCAGCRAKEARYGFRPEGEDDPTLERPRTLCFECFRVEVTRRQLVREHMRRGWNAKQVGLPLQDTLRTLDKRRRRAQIAARHALGS
jgi:hypothetical protein